jgi:hypothetical protein
MLPSLTDKEITLIGLSDNPLLTKFINLRLQEAVEPVREGIPKGDKIGFVREKIIAAILKGVTILSLKQIADALKKSPAVVRFWNSQEQVFKDRAKQEKALFKKAIKSAEDLKVKVLVDKNVKTDREISLDTSLLFENIQLYQDDIAHILKSYRDVTITKLDTMLTPQHWNILIASTRKELESVQKEIAEATKKNDTEKVKQLISVKLPQVMDRFQRNTRLAELTKKHKE